MLDRPRNRTRDIGRATQIAWLAANCEQANPFEQIGSLLELQSAERSKVRQSGRTTDYLR
jgi:hypothetical protein